MKADSNLFQRSPPIGARRDAFQDCPPASLHFYEAKTSACPRHHFTSVTAHTSFHTCQSKRLISPVCSEISLFTLFHTNIVCVFNSQSAPTGKNGYLVTGLQLMIRGTADGYFYLASGFQYHRAIISICVSAATFSSGVNHCTDLRIIRVKIGKMIHMYRYAEGQKHRHNQNHNCKR